MKIHDSNSRDSQLKRDIQREFEVDNLFAIDLYKTIENNFRFVPHNLELPIPFDSRSLLL